MIDTDYIAFELTKHELELATTLNKAQALLIKSYEARIRELEQELPEKLRIAKHKLSLIRGDKLIRCSCSICKPKSRCTCGLCVMRPRLHNPATCCLREYCPYTACREWNWCNK